MAIDYPIDFVFPTVYQTDINWQITYKKVCERLGKPVNLNSQRFRSWDTERFIFRGIEKFMPWIRTVHFVVCAPSQVPAWMNTEKVHVVLHKDIIPREYRPTFNSCCIEMFLKNIPGLAEHFIYSNDDLFITEPIAKTEFFRRGYPCLHHRKVRYSDTQNLFRHQCKTGLDMICRDFKVYPDGFIWKNTHSMTPMLKSTLEKVWDLHSSEIKKSISKFREPYNMNQYIYSYYQYLSGQFVDYVPKNLYTCFTDYSLDEICKIIEAGNSGLLCINDAGKNIKFQLYKQRLIRSWLKLLPEKSKYEL